MLVPFPAPGVRTEASAAGKFDTNSAVVFSDKKKRKNDCGSRLTAMVCRVANCIFKVIR